MAEVKRRQTKAGEARYDVRVRIGGRVVTRTFKRRKDADDYARLIEADRVRGMAVDPRAGAEKLAPYAARWVDQRRKKGGLPLAPRASRSGGCRPSPDRWRRREYMTVDVHGGLARRLGLGRL